MSLVDSFFRHAERAPGRSAFVLEKKRLTYAELSEIAERYRCAFPATGIAIDDSKPTVQPRNQSSGPPHELVGWCGENHPHLGALYLALAREGHVLVLFDHTWPETLRQRLSEQLGVNALETPSTLDSVCNGQTPEPRTFDRVLRAESGKVDLASSLFLIGFTSGSTGDPKAFARTQASWSETFRRSSIEFDNAASGQVFAPGPLSHGLSFYAMAETLEAGGTFHSCVRFDAAVCIKKINEWCISSLVVVPTMLVAILKVVEKDPTLAALAHDSGKLRRITSAGAKLPVKVRAEILKLFPAATISEYYGASELSFVAVAHEADAPPDGSVGRVFSGVQLSVRTQSGGEAVPCQPGIVHIKSGMLAEGYLSSKGVELAMDPLDGQNEWKTVGDIGYLDQQGYLFLTDRIDNMMISGGLNVYPGEVERVLCQHPAVVDCLVTSLPDEYWGELIVAVVQLAKNTSGNPVVECEQLDVFCQRFLPAGKRPKMIVEIEHFPLTSSGKIDRPAIRAGLLEQQARLDLIGVADTDHE